MKQYKIITAFFIFSIMLMIFCKRTEAMEETAYGYTEISFSDIRQEFAEKYQQKKEIMKYRDMIKFLNNTPCA